MANVLKVSVLTPERVMFEGDVKYLSLPGSAGYMGVLVDHAPLLSSLQPGKIEIRPVQGDSLHFSITRGGFLEITKNRVSILLDAADSNAILTDVK